MKKLLVAAMVMVSLAGCTKPSEEESVVVRANFKFHPDEESGETSAPGRCLKFLHHQELKYCVIPTITIDDKPYLIPGDLVRPVVKAIERIVGRYQECAFTSRSQKQTIYAKIVFVVCKESYLHLDFQSSGTRADHQAVKEAILDMTQGKRGKTNCTKDPWQR